MQVKKQQLKPDMEQWTGSKLGKEYFKTVYCHPVNLTYMLLLLLQSCPTLCNPIDSSPRGSAIPGILQARTLEWVAISFSNAWKWKVKSESEVAQSCPTFHNPMDCSLPGSSTHGIFQATILEWGAIAFFITYIQGTLCDMPGWMKRKLESRLPGEIPITLDMQMTPPLWQKAKN